MTWSEIYVSGLTAALFAARACIGSLVLNLNEMRSVKWSSPVVATIPRCRRKLLAEADTGGFSQKKWFSKTSEYFQEDTCV